MSITGRHRKITWHAKKERKGGPRPRLPEEPTPLLPTFTWSEIAWRVVVIVFVTIAAFVGAVYVIADVFDGMRVSSGGRFAAALTILVTAGVTVLLFSRKFG